MLPYAHALALVLADVVPKTPHTIRLDGDSVLGQVTAETIRGPVALPPFDNAAMDGFAVQTAAVTTATADHPVILPVAGHTMAGDRPNSGSQSNSGEHRNDTAWEIMTGAPMPAGYDAVIPIEEITLIPGLPPAIAVKTTAFPGRNIRRAGADFMPGDPVLEPGMALTPNHVAVLAALGQQKIAVVPPPRTAVISTGKELVDNPAMTLGPGQIRDSNRPYLLHNLAACGLPAVDAGVVSDQPAVFQEKLAGLLKQDVQVILSSGAVSMGRHDFVPESLKKMGADIIFHTVAMRPGKPLLFARFPGGAYYFGLPGNPIASAVGLRFFVYPLLQKLWGLPPEKPVSAVLQNSFSKNSDFRFFQKAVYTDAADGQQQVTLLSGQESFRLKPLLAQNCWAVIGEEARDVKPGTILDIYPL